jgi:hypothetical protein
MTTREAKKRDKTTERLAAHMGTAKYRQGFCDMQNYHSPAPSSEVWNVWSFTSTLLNLLCTGKYRLYHINYCKVFQHMWWTVRSYVIPSGHMSYRPVICHTVQSYVILAFALGSWHMHPWLGLAVGRKRQPWQPAHCQCPEQRGRYMQNWWALLVHYNTIQNCYNRFK